MCNAIIHSNGIVTCSNCGYEISADAVICPCCKSPIDGHVDEKELSKSDKKKLKRKKVRDFSWVPICLIVVIAGFYLGYRFDVVEPVTNFINEQIIENWDGTGIKGFVNNVKTKNERRKEAIDNGLSGYDYKMTQIYLESEEDPDVEAALSNFLTDSSINFDNLRYDNSGYYIADLHKMPTYFTEAEYSASQDELLTSYETYVSENAFILTGRNLYIQGTHKTVEGNFS